jgi:hypothetical protein
MVCLQRWKSSGFLIGEPVHLDNTKEQTYGIGTTLASCVRNLFRKWKEHTENSNYNASNLPLFRSSRSTVGITKHWSCLRCPDDEQGVGKDARSLTIRLSGKSDSGDEMYQGSL